MHIKPATHWIPESPSGVKIPRMPYGSTWATPWCGTFVRRAGRRQRGGHLHGGGGLCALRCVPGGPMASYRSAQLPAHVLSIGAARGAVGKALLRLPASCLLDPITPSHITINALLREDHLRFLASPQRAVCGFPAPRIRMESIEQMIGDGNENHLGRTRRTRMRSTGKVSSKYSLSCWGMT